MTAQQTLDPLTAAAPAAGSASGERALRAARDIAAFLFGPPEERDFAIRYWDGSTDAAGAAEGAPAFTLVIARPGALRRILLPPSELAIGEAFVRGDIDVEGDMESATALVDVVMSCLASLRSPGTLFSLLRNVLALPSKDPAAYEAQTPKAFDLTESRHTRHRAATAVRYHYDLSNDFYKLWLGKRLLYTCAYYPTGTEDLDTAQESKLEHICRKLRLKAGETLLDMGCGWGSLVIYAAQRFGVKALGVTISKQQGLLAQERIRELGLEDRCRVDIADYRDLPDAGPFDKVVSVGLLEHVGREQAATFFAQAYRHLKPGGLFLHHSGVLPSKLVDLGWAQRVLWRQGEWLHKYVFPDCEEGPLSEVIAQGEAAGFEARDVENLREHYALTLRAWLHNIEARRDEIVAMVGDPVYRIFRVYTATAARGYAIGRMILAQVLFSKTTQDGLCLLPYNRADLYR